MKEEIDIEKPIIQDENYEDYELGILEDHKNSEVIQAISILQRRIYTRSVVLI